MSELEKLIEAAKQCDLAGVKSVLEGRPELLHERDQSGATALHYATFAGHRSVVGELVRQGAREMVDSSPLN
jgi:ankyrin repeat protein